MRKGLMMSVRHKQGKMHFTQLASHAVIIAFGLGIQSFHNYEILAGPIYYCSKNLIKIHSEIYCM